MKSLKSLFHALLTLSLFTGTDVEFGVPGRAAQAAAGFDEGVTFTPDEIAPDEQESETSRHVAALLSQLESGVFAERQNALRRMMELEADSVGILEESLPDVSPGVASQLRVIIPRLRSKLFDEQIRLLESMPSAIVASRLPDWDRFSAAAGSGTSAISVYRELLLAEKELFAARLFRSPTLSNLLEARSREFALRCDGRAEEEFPVASCAALMLLGSDPEVRLRGATSTNISSALDDARFAKLVDDGVHATFLRAIVSQWIQRPDIAVDRPLLFSMRHQLPAGRQLALKTLERSPHNQRTYYALLCLAVLGDPARNADAAPQTADDLAVIEALLESDAKLWPPQGQLVRELLPGMDVDSTYSVQTRDVALAVAMHLRGRHPRELGMRALPSARTLYSVESLGFNTDDDRKAAITRYRTLFPAP